VLAEGTRPGDPWVVYCGNSQARSPRPSERGPKGAAVVQVSGGRVVRVEHVPCDRVRFEELMCPIDELAGLENLEDRLATLAADALEGADGRSLVVRGRLVGRGPLHRELARPGTVDGLLAHLRDGGHRSGRFCWWDAVVDESAPDLDLEGVRARGDFSSDLLALAESLRDDPAACASLASELAAAVPRSLASDTARLTGDPDRLAALLASATTLALDELSGGEA
jgi:hypothetical protein